VRSRVSEGPGADRQRSNGKNVILFYDELSALVSKCRIEGSGMNSALLKLYDSNNFANSTKSKKDAYNVEPGSYCATLITATTDRKFAELWSQLAGEDTGLNDRFTWVLEPRVLPELKLEKVVNYHEAALATRKLIDRAVDKKTFEFFDKTPLQRILEIQGNRSAHRAEKWALYFAIDLGLSEIDEDCVERGIALARYESEVKKYLMTYEAKNDESNIQQSVVRLLKKSQGKMELREMERKLNVSRYGTTLWNRAFNGLYQSGYIIQDGRGVKGDPKIVKLIRDMRFSDE